MSYDRRDESIMNPSVSTGVESTNITRLRFQWHCRVRGWGAVFFAVDGPPWTKATTTCAAAQALAEAMDWQVDLHDYDLEVGPGPLEWWCCGATRCDQKLLCLIKKNEVSCPAKKRVLPRSDDGWMFYYFLWYVSCWFLMESSIHQAVEITYLVPHCSGSLLLAKQEQ